MTEGEHGHCFPSFDYRMARGFAPTCIQFIDIARLPLSAALREVASPRQASDWAVSGGDDYELLLAVPPARLAALEHEADTLGLRLTVIGECREGAGVTWSIDGAAAAAPAGGYDHFR